MDGFFPTATAPLVGICISQTLPPPSKGCGYARLQHIYSYLFSILLHLTFQQCLFKDYKCIFAITTSNYSFQFQLRGFRLIGLDIAQAHVWPCPLLDQPTSPSE